MLHVHDGGRVGGSGAVEAGVSEDLPACPSAATWVPAPEAQIGHRSDTATAASTGATCRPTSTIDADA